MVGILCIPAFLTRFAFRVLAAWLLIVISLMQHVWESVEPLCRPLIDIYYAHLDPCDVSLMGILRQYIKMVLMTWVLAYKAIKTVYEVTTCPIRDHLNRFWAWFQQIRDEFEQGEGPVEEGEPQQAPAPPAGPE